MEYVMVPVPEELVAAVERYLLLHTNTVRPASSVFDHDAAARVLFDLDEQTRALLLRASEAVDEGVVYTVRDAAEAAGLSEREVLGLCVELNNVVRTAGGPPVTVVPMLQEASATGPRAWPLTMAGDIAGLFAAAGRRRDLHG
jgi:hypothetical protein